MTLNTARRGGIPRIRAFPDGRGRRGRSGGEPANGFLECNIPGIWPAGWKWNGSALLTVAGLTSNPSAGERENGRVVPGGGTDLLTPSPIHLPGEGIRCCSWKGMTFISTLIGIDEENRKWRPQAPPTRARCRYQSRGGARSQMWLNITSVILGVARSSGAARLNPSHQDTRHGSGVDLWLIVVYSQCPGGNGSEESWLHLWGADVDLPLRLRRRKD